jgi:hypothetical protein
MLADCTDPNLLKIIKLLRSFLQLIQVLVPIGLIVMGSIDLGKGVISSNEDDIKKGQKIFIKRCISAILVFLVATIVSFVMSFVGSNSWKSCWQSAAAATSGSTSSTGEGNWRYRQSIE